MSDVVRRLLEPFLADLSAAGLGVRLEDGAWQEWPHAESLHVWLPDGSGVGVWCDTSQPEVQQVVDLADQLHEWVVECLPGLGRPSNWPRCPEHPDNHPLEVAVERDRAVWRCPTARTVVAPLGRL